MNEFSISVCNMDRFLTIQCAKEFDVEEVQVQEHFETLTTKHNNVLVFKFNEKWKDGSGCVQDGCW